MANPCTDHDKRIGGNTKIRPFYVSRKSLGINKSPLAIDSPRVHCVARKEDLSDLVGHGNVAIGCGEVLPSQWSQVKVESRLKFVEMTQDWDGR